MEKLVLIVDDDVDTLQLVGTMLERKGFKIAAANNGTKGIELAINKNPDVILLDVMMPGIDGFEVARRLRSTEKTQFIPIIFFTAKSQVDDKIEGFEAGGDDYLTKPIHPTELILRINKILEKPRTGALGDPDDNLVEQQKGKVVGVLAAKGGYGVSTFAINLGFMLKSKMPRSSQICLAEYRIGSGDVGSYLGFDESKGLTNILQNSSGIINVNDVESELVPFTNDYGLLLSSYTPEDQSLKSNPDDYIHITNALSKLNDYVVLDLGAEFSTKSKEVLKLCNTIVLLIEPNKHSIIRSKALYEWIIKQSINPEQVKVVVYNKVRLEITVPATQIADQLEAPIDAYFSPAPELAYQAATMHQPMVAIQRDSLIANQFNKFVEKIYIE